MDCNTGLQIYIKNKLNLHIPIDIIDLIISYSVSMFEVVLEDIVCENNQLSARIYVVCDLVNFTIYHSSISVNIDTYEIAQYVCNACDYCDYGDEYKYCDDFLSETRIDHNDGNATLELTDELLEQISNKQQKFVFTAKKIIRDGLLDMDPYPNF